MWISQHQKSKQFSILMKQEMMGGIGINWTIYTSLRTDIHATTSPLSFCRPTNSIRALFEYFVHHYLPESV